MGTNCAVHHRVTLIRATTHTHTHTNTPAPTTHPTFTPTPTQRGPWRYIGERMGTKGAVHNGVTRILAENSENRMQHFPVCMYIHVYVTYICIYIHVYMYIYMCIHIYELIHIYRCMYIYTYIFMSIYVHIYIGLCTRIYTYKHICMGWLRLVGSLKLQVSFEEYCVFYRALLQKRPIMLRSLLIEATLIQI